MKFLLKSLSYSVLLDGPHHSYFNLHIFSSSKFLKNLNSKYLLLLFILLAPRTLKPDRHTYFHSYLYSSAFYNPNFKNYIKHVFNHGSALYRKVINDFFPHW